MKNHVNGQVMAIAEPCVTLDELRQHVLLPLIGNSLFSEAEQLRANHFVHECEDIARLTRWETNVLAEIACRQAEAARQRCHLATCATLRQLRPSFRGYRPRKLKPRLTWVPSTFFPECANRWAGTFDRLAVARFQRDHTLTYAQLLRR
jgi:hypothetical protein